MKTSPLGIVDLGTRLPYSLILPCRCGLVDTAVIGNLGSAQDLGAIAFGALIFSFVLGFRLSRDGHYRICGAGCRAGLS